MNEIERAIQIIERQKLQIGIDYTNGKDLTAICLVGNSAETALEALREAAERSKGCVWCRDDNRVFHDGQHFHMFCSYCGKRLEVKQDG